MVSIKTKMQHQSAQDLTKICTKCSSELPASTDFFYRNKGGKYGLTPRCKKCVDDDNRANLAKRMAKDPEEVKRQANMRAKRHYYKDIDKSRKRNRDAARKARQDPDRRAIINARKRGGGAGLIPDQIEQIRVSQNNMCAICSDLNPTNLDHCHKTGAVRWLLCTHCNRGLGAFKDSPELLRKAAKLIEGD